MSPAPIRETAAGIDLSPRFFNTQVVAASPALAAETVIATLTTSGDIASIAGVYLLGWAAFTIGTSGVSSQLRIRQTNTSGTVVVDSGAVTAGVAATKIETLDAQGFDASPVLPGQVYVLTLQIASGAAASTVSAVSLFGLVV